MIISYEWYFRPRFIKIIPRNNYCIIHGLSQTLSHFSYHYHREYNMMMQLPRYVVSFTTRLLT